MMAAADQARKPFRIRGHHIPGRIFGGGFADRCLVRFHVVVPRAARFRAIGLRPMTWFAAAPWLTHLLPIRPARGLEFDLHFRRAVSQGVAPQPAGLRPPARDHSRIRSLVEREAIQRHRCLRGDGGVLRRTLQPEQSEDVARTERRDGLLLSTHHASQLRLAGLDDVRRASRNPLRPSVDMTTRLA